MKLTRMNDLQPFMGGTTDGHLGRVDAYAFSFDHTSFTASYLVVDTDGWLTAGRSLCLPTRPGRFGA